MIDLPLVFSFTFLHYLFIWVGLRVVTVPPYVLLDKLSILRSMSIGYLKKM